MEYLPIFLDANKLSGVVIGGGNVAARKIELLLKTKTKITVVSPELKEPVALLINNNDIRYIDSTYNKDVLIGQNLVIAATNIKDINKTIAADASELNLLINVVDDPQLCNYITPAIVDRAPMIVAMSSSGTAPILLQQLKHKIDLMLPSSYGKLAEFCGKYRLKVQAQIGQFAARKQFWQNIFASKIADAVLDNNIEQADVLMHQQLANVQNKQSKTITVIELQDQNPDSLTLSAYQAMQKADTIIIEAEIDTSFFDYGRRDANKISTIDFDYISAIHNDYDHLVIICHLGNNITKQVVQLDTSPLIIQCGSAKKVS